MTVLERILAWLGSGFTKDIERVKTYAGFYNTAVRDSRDEYILMELPFNVSVTDTITQLDVGKILSFILLTVIVVSCCYVIVKLIIRR